MAKIGLLTLPFGPNYGMVLQVFALQTQLEKMGHDVVVINRKWNRIKKNRGLLSSVKRFIYHEVFCKKIYSFYKSRLKLTIPCYTSEDVLALCNSLSVDFVVIGSDQVWRIENTRGANLDFFGGFAPSGISFRFLSYAASFGNNDWKGSLEETVQVNKLLHRFKSISVREKSAISLCRSLFDIEPECSLDPTLLLCENEYPMKEMDSEEGCIVSYILDHTKEKRDFIHDIADHLRFNKILNLYSYQRTYPVYKYSVYEWLGYLKKASFIVTDSFHGMVFSIIFKKQFIVVGNRKRGIDRFISLLSSLGIPERIIDDFDKFDIAIINNKIDYKLVNKSLERLKAESFNYLKNNLNVWQ